MLKHLLQGDICSIVISFLNIYSICTLLQISKEFRSLIDKCKLKNKKRVELKALPQNSILFEGICYFKIWYDEDLSNIPIKQNDTHLIQFNRLLNDWNEKNPVGYGVSWICTMEVSIRIVNIIISLMFLYDYLDLKQSLH